jgi:hypothetical protein
MRLPRHEGLSPNAICQPSLHTNKRQNSFIFVTYLIPKFFIEEYRFIKTMVSDLRHIIF